MSPQPSLLESKVNALALAVKEASSTLATATAERDRLQAALADVERGAGAELARAEQALLAAQEAFDADPKKKDAYLKAQEAKRSAQRAPQADLERARRLVAKAQEAVTVAQSSLDTAHDALGALRLSREFIAEQQAPIASKLLAARRLLMQAWVEHRDLVASVHHAGREHPRVLTEDDGEGGTRRVNIQFLLPSLDTLERRVSEVLKEERSEPVTPEGVRVPAGERTGLNHDWVQAHRYATGGR